MTDSKIKTILNSMISEGFFSTPKDVNEVINRLSQRGFTINGPKVGLIGRMLTQICQDLSTGMEREEIPETERRGREGWKYKKVR